MSLPLIVLGDKTSHGGTVITASLFSDTHGKGWARMGDMVACPLCKGVFPISEGDASLTDDGKPVAYHGCKVACGAILIASQMFTTTVRSSGVAHGAESNATDDAAMAGFGSVGEGLLAAYQDEELENTQDFRGRFQVLDQATGEPVSALNVRVRSPDGQYVICTTDAEG